MGLRQAEENSRDFTKGLKMSKHNASQMNREARRSLARKSTALGSAGLLAGGATTALFAAFALPASATTLTVDTTADGAAVAGDCTNGTAGDCSLRDALAAAANGDTITFDSAVTGTITLTQGELKVLTAVNLVGPGASTLTVDAAGASRVFYVFSSTASGDVSISGLTITGGVSSYYGGGIHFHWNGNTTVDSVVVTGNSASSGGGGITFDHSGVASVLNSSIVSNTTSDGGGGGLLIRGDGSAVISNSTIANNSADFAGGGVYLYSAVESVTISGTTIDANVATGINGDGGITAAESVAVTIENSTLSNNIGGSNSSAGAAALWNAQIFNSTIANNAGGRTGGILLRGGRFPSELTLTQTTVSGNSATAPLSVGAYEPGGGITTRGEGKVNLHGSIVSGNTSTVAGSDDIAFDLEFGTGGHFHSYSSMVGAVSGRNIEAGSDNLYSSSPGLDALAENGGLTKTMALQAGSLAIDAGPNPVDTFVGNGFDQRGAPYVRVFNGIADMGAFEYQPEPEPVPTTTTPGTDPVIPKFTG